jgi:Zn-dependent peptidase ImmA (M78 family)
VGLLSCIYKPFPLDSWVSKLYKRIGINDPNEICERKISYSLGIHLTYSERRNYARDEGRFKLININNDQDITAKREIFFHELCHILRHEGSQYMMPKAFRELQEWDCGHFTRYAAIPFHMLHTVDWKSPTLIEDMSNKFKVSEELCRNRVDHIYRNMLPQKVI